MVGGTVEQPPQNELRPNRSSHPALEPVDQPRRLQAHRLELLGQLTGGIAHDFNNLLTAIDGHIELAGSALDPTSAAAKSLSVASACARRAASLSRRLLEFHRTPTFDPRLVDPNGVIDGTVEFLAPLIRTNISLQVDHGSELPDIPADRVQIQQALMNLVLNAQSAMSDGGTLWLRASEQWVDESFVARYPWGKSGRYVRLEVEDTGVGIDPNDCENIFRPFFSARAGGLGTGLGLSIVYGIIKQHRGFIGVESALNKGTLFWMLLPVDASTCPIGLESSGEVRSGGQQQQVLVLEDEVVVRQLAASILANDGYRVLEASSSAEALAQIENHGHIDLLVADVMINGGTAVEFVTRMRAENPHLPVIYSSGYDPEQLNIDLHLDSKSLFLDKPYSLAQLRNAVKKLTAAI